jgi:hypothetical protein
MAELKERHKVAINKFIELLRSGKDYGVDHMYSEAGKVSYISFKSVERVVNKYYGEVITQDMINFVNRFSCSREESIKQFSEKFNVCRRESILLIRYIRRRNG